MRGSPQGGVTATADNVAAAANNVRIEMMVGFTKDAVAGILRSVAWYMFNSEFFVMELSEAYGKRYGLSRPAYAGGPHSQTENLRFDQLALDIQPYSLERVDPIVMQGRVQQVGQIILSTLPARMSTPWFNWKLFDAQLARAHNFSWLEELVDENKLQQFIQAQQQAAGQQGGQPPRPPSVTINYKDLPEDDKRAAEQKAGLPPSQQPQTTPTHIQNAMAMQQAPARVPLAHRMMGRAARIRGEKGLVPA